jgi:hypothetical protein
VVKPTATSYLGPYLSATRPTSGAAKDGAVRARKIRPAAIELQPKERWTKRGRTESKAHNDGNLDEVGRLGDSESGGGLLRVEGCGSSGRFIFEDGAILGGPSVSVIRDPVTLFFV